MLEKSELNARQELQRTSRFDSRAQLRAELRPTTRHPQITQPFYSCNGTAMILLSHVAMALAYADRCLMQRITLSSDDNSEAEATLSILRKQ